MVLAVFVRIVVLIVDVMAVVLVGSEITATKTVSVNRLSASSNMINFL